MPSLVQWKMYGNGVKLLVKLTGPLEYTTMNVWGVCKDSVALTARAASDPSVANAEVI